MTLKLDVGTCIFSQQTCNSKGCGAKAKNEMCCSLGKKCCKKYKRGKSHCKSCPKK